MPEHPVIDEEIAYLLQRGHGTELLKTLLPLLAEKRIASEVAIDPGESTDAGISESAPPYTAELSNSRSSEIWFRIACELAKAECFDEAEQSLRESELASSQVASSTLGFLTMSLASVTILAGQQTFGLPESELHQPTVARRWTTREWDLTYEAIAFHLDSMDRDSMSINRNPVTTRALHALLCEMRVAIDAMPELQSRLPKFASLVARVGCEEEVLTAFVPSNKPFISAVDAESSAPLMVVPIAYATTEFKIIQKHRSSPIKRKTSRKRVRRT